jgi:hypothetical protein
MKKLQTKYTASNNNTSQNEKLATFFFKKNINPLLLIYFCSQAYFNQITNFKSRGNKFIIYQLKIFNALYN